MRTIHDPLPDGLYADLGAEQCTKPGYELIRQYAQEFGLELLPYPRRDGEARYIDGKLIAEEMLADRKVLGGLGFNDREADFLTRHEWHDLPLLFYKPYLDSFTDEYRPFWMSRKFRSASEPSASQGVNPHPTLDSRGFFLSQRPWKAMVAFALKKQIPIIFMALRGVA